MAGDGRERRLDAGGGEGRAPWSIFAPVKGAWEVRRKHSEYEVTTVVKEGCEPLPNQDF